MITAYGDAETRQKVLAGGAVDLITKPIDFDLLRTEIESRLASVAGAGMTSDLPPAKILVVDDEPDLEALITQKFRRQIRGGQVTFLFAHDGHEALELLGANRDVDLVVSDINMPGMDGLTLLAKLQESDDKLSTIIVSATATWPISAPP